MSGISSSLSKAKARSGRIFAVTTLAVALPLAAHASPVLATFDWVSGGPTPENPTSAQTTTSSGTLELEFSPFALTTTGTGNFGPNYYTSGTATTASIVSFSYTAGNGLSVSQ